jgi:hypothetical protein
MIRHSASTRHKKPSIKSTLYFNHLLKEMDSTVVKSFTNTQLNAIKNAIYVRECRTHHVDLRPTLALPFIPWSFYIVLLIGVNRRSLSSSEKAIATVVFLLVIFISGLAVAGLLFLILYLFKSWLGIDILGNHSLGLWDEFKNLFN